jgi:hypothetical protein
VRLDEEVGTIRAERAEGLINSMTTPPSAFSGVEILRLWMVGPVGLQADLPPLINDLHISILMDLAFIYLKSGARNVIALGLLLI